MLLNVRKQIFRPRIVLLCSLAGAGLVGLMRRMRLLHKTEPGGVYQSGHAQSALPVLGGRLETTYRHRCHHYLDDHLRRLRTKIATASDAEQRRCISTRANNPAPDDRGGHPRSLDRGDPRLKGDVDTRLWSDKL